MVRGSTARLGAEPRALNPERWGRDLLQQGVGARMRDDCMAANMLDGCKH